MFVINFYLDWHQLALLFVALISFHEEANCDATKTKPEDQ